MDKYYYKYLAERLINESRDSINCKWRLNLTDGKDGESMLLTINERPEDFMKGFLWNYKDSEKRKSPLSFGNGVGQMIVAILPISKDRYTLGYVGNVIENTGKKNAPGYSVKANPIYGDLIGRVIFHHHNLGSALIRKFDKKFTSQITNLLNPEILDEPCICEESLKVLKSDFIL